jgi:hypothetical protein
MKNDHGANLRMFAFDKAYTLGGEAADIVINATIFLEFLNGTDFSPPLTSTVSRNSDGLNEPSPNVDDVYVDDMEGLKNFDDGKGSIHTPKPPSTASEATTVMPDQPSTEAESYNHVIGALSGAHAELVDRLCSFGPEASVPSSELVKGLNMTSRGASAVLKRLSSAGYCEQVQKTPYALWRGIKQSDGSPSVSEGKGHAKPEEPSAEDEFIPAPTKKVKGAAVDVPLSQEKFRKPRPTPETGRATPRDSEYPSGAPKYKGFCTNSPDYSQSEKDGGA